jgi:DNA repair exonuclease SbcCD ATPase subunit
MRLHSVTVRNYRLHRELSVSFDASRNLMGGPNETGKSTLAEALHRALFLRSKTGGNLREEMRSKRHPGEPEVDLNFEAEGRQWTLKKRFAGSKGSTHLTDASGQVYKDDEAETRLAEILQCTTNSGRASASQLAGQWSHLWVWQGCSSSDPSSHTSDHKDTLVQRLQQDGLAAVMQSATDQRVRERIAASYDELFTTTGRPKAGSKPELARLQLAKAEDDLLRVQQTAERLEQAAADHQRAENQIAEVDAILPQLRDQRAATEAKLIEVETLRRQEADQRQQWEAAATRLQQLNDQDTSIRKLHDQATTSRGELAPTERLEAELLAKEKSAAELSQTAETTQRERADAVRHIRLQHDLAAALIASFEKALQHQQLADRSDQAAQLRRELTSHQETLSKLPNLTAKELEALRKLERIASQAAASLDAMATGIELLSAEGTVTLDGHALALGESRTLTDAGELAIGATRLRIRPGGGTSLADARLLLENSQRNLTVALDRHTVRDLDHATAVLQQRQTRCRQIDQLETQWKALGGESLVHELANASAAHEAAKSEVQRRLEAIEPPPPLAENLAAARQFHASLQQKLQLAEESEAVTRHQSAQYRQRLDAASGHLQNHREQTAKARQALRDLETRLQVLQETHGDAPTRAAARADAISHEKHTAEQLAATRTQLATLVPDLLAADLDRFTRALAQQETRRRDAENLRLVNRDRLTLDGSTDPHAELALAEARRNAAFEHHQSEQRRAQAIERLNHLFSSSREAIDRSIIQPLADRISGYLQCLFGPATQVSVHLSETGIDSFELLRPGDPAFRFATLSGGAKEQVAAAVRLAMAEILAADHDGCLPILFDDAFAFTDPDRIQALQRMLDLAATRGLQVIVLTCTPADYLAFGAREIRMSSLQNSTAPLDTLE